MTFVVVRSNEKGCEPNCPQWIMAEGQIEAGSPAAFRAVLDAHKDEKLPVVLHSVGGDVLGALQIGLMIRREGLATAVGRTNYKGCSPDSKKCKLKPDQSGVYSGRAYSGDGFCISACPFIYAAGAQRASAKTAIIGVHKVRMAETPPDGANKNGASKTKMTAMTETRKAVMVKIFEDYLVSMGVSTKLLEDMDRASGENWYRVTQKRQLQLELTTNTGGVEALTSRQACKIEPPARHCIMRPAQPDG